MTEIILITLGGIFALIGLTEAICGLRLIFMLPKEKALTYLIVYLTDENAVHQLKYAAEQTLWSGRRYADNIVAVNTNLSELNDIECKKICENNGFIYCTYNEIIDKEYSSLIKDENNT